MDPGVNPLSVRNAAYDDVDSIASIYNYYVLNSTATFEEMAVTSCEIKRRMEAVFSASLPYLVLEMQGELCGYCYAKPWKERSAYRYTVESSIFLHPTYTGRGYGTRLYQALITQLSNLGVHAVIAGVALPNPSSLALHKKLGFCEVALFREVGWKFEHWIDVAYWELLMGA